MLYFRIMLLLMEVWFLVTKCQECFKTFCYPSHQFRSTRHNVCEKFSKIFSNKTEMMKALLPLRYHPGLVTKLFPFFLLYCLRLEHITLAILAKVVWHHCLRLTICVFDPCPVGTLTTFQFGTYYYYNLIFFICFWFYPCCYHTDS